MEKSNQKNRRLTYKTGMGNSMWRFSSVSVSCNSTNNETGDDIDKTSGFGFGLSAGKEYHRDIKENFQLKYGADLSFSYTFSKTENDDKTVADQDREDRTTRYRQGVNLVFGLNYIFKNNLKFGAELLPGVSYSTGKTVVKRHFINNGEEQTTDNSRFSFGLSNSSVRLSLSYRFLLLVIQIYC